MDDLITISKRDATETLLALTGHKTVRDLAEHVAEHELEEFYDGGVLDAIDAVIDMPSAQPEIIRCRECVWWKDGDCRNLRGLYHPKEEGFCSMAERKK